MYKFVMLYTETNDCIWIFIEEGFNIYVHIMIPMVESFKIMNNILFMTV